MCMNENVGNFKLDEESCIREKFKICLNEHFESDTLILRTNVKLVRL